MPPQGIVNEEDEQEKLDQDYSTPFSAPSGVHDTTDDTHPQADTNVDAHEHYDEGISGADETTDQSNTVVMGYKPPTKSDDSSDDKDDDDSDDAEEE